MKADGFRLVGNTEGRGLFGVDHHELDNIVRQAFGLPLNKESLGIIAPDNKKDPDYASCSASRSKMRW
jgi:hypothetical protein